MGLWICHIGLIGHYIGHRIVIEQCDNVMTDVTDVMNNVIKVMANVMTDVTYVMTNVM